MDDDASLDDIAPASIAVVGRKELGGRGYAHVRLAQYARDRRPGPTEVETPGATLLDIGGGWRVQRALELRGLVRNLLDDRSYASPDPRWVLAPGRSVSATAVLQF